MGKREIKVDAFAVSRHSEKLKQRNSNLKTKASNSMINGGRTNFKGYINGIEYRDELGKNLNTLVDNIRQDCDNIRYAAAELNGLDVEISKKLDGKGVFLMK